MKFAIIGDTHFGVARSNEQFHQYFKMFFAEFFEYTKKNKIKHVVQTGDLFDYRKEVHFNTLYNVKQYFYSEIEKQGIKLYVVCGNHDSLYTNTNRINSVRLLLEDKPWATIVDMVPTTVDIGGFPVDLYPWVNKENLQLVTDFAAECNSDIAIGHFEFSQFQLSPGISIEHGMDHRIFKEYHTVFSGHFHTHSQRDNIIYTGTPYELTWIDSADPKGFWVFDSETMEAERVINKNQLFVKIGYTDGLEYDFSTLRDKHVKVVEIYKADQKKFDSFIASVNSAQPHSLKIIESAVVEAVNQAVGSEVDVSSTQSVIMGVLEGVETQLDIDTLKKKVSEKYAEALNILNTI